MDTFDVRCDCGTTAEVTVPSSLDVGNWHCPSCGAALNLHPETRKLRPQHDTSKSPKPQYGTSHFRGGDYGY